MFKRIALTSALITLMLASTSSAFELNWDRALRAGVTGAAQGYGDAYAASARERRAERRARAQLQREQEMLRYQTKLHRQELLEQERMFNERMERYKQQSNN